MNNYPFPAYSGYGIEIEYMIVDRDTLQVAPVADKLLAQVGVAEDMDIIRDKMAWSNELALHVVEVKTNGPTSHLEEAAQLFRAEVLELNRLLAPMNACLLPGGMHGGMDPMTETRLWPHQNDEIYQAFDRIFNCRGHGWSNLQSTHINFPFQTEEEFAALHAACRFVLPLLPALAASSPFREGIIAENRDQRLFEYQQNCARVPSVSGLVIPEAVFTEADYQDMLSSIYRDLAPHDPEGILAEEWVNARGCIARFDRGAIEIRLLDNQECPEQDLAIVSAVTTVVRALAEGEFSPLIALKSWSPETLRKILDRAIQSAEEGLIGDDGYVQAWGADPAVIKTMGELWRHILGRVGGTSNPFAAGQAVILDHGTLASRLIKSLNSQTPDPESLNALNRRLTECLAEGKPFLP